MSIEIQKTIFEGNGKAEIFNFRPENIEKEKRGNLFVVGKIAKKLPRHDQQYYILNSLAAIVKKEYYSASSTQPSETFDKALKKANGLLLEIPQNIANAMELIILALVGEQVSFSSVGWPEILLLREERIFRLHKNSRSQKNLPYSVNENSRKVLFRYVTKGRVRAEDKLIIADSGLTKYLENTHFKLHLAKRPWERIREYLKRERIKAGDKSTLPIIEISLTDEVRKVPAKSGVVLTASSFLLPYGDQLLKPSQVYTNPSSSPTSQLHLPILPEPEGKSIFPHLLTGRSFAHWHHTSNNNISKGWREFTKILRPAMIISSRRYTIFLIGTFAVIIAGGSMLLKNKNKTAQQANPLSNAQMEAGLFSMFPRPEKSPATVFQPLYARFFQRNIFAIWQNQLYQIDSNSQKIEPLLQIQGEIKGMSSFKDTILILIKKAPENMEIVFFNPSERSVKREILLWPLKTYSIKDMREFNGNLYLLEDLEKQIIKYDLRDLSRPALWLSEKTKNQLQNPLSFTLERSIYLLGDNIFALSELYAGSIKRHIPFDGKANAVYTSLELKNLYLFDSEKGRILIIQKETGKTLKIIKDSRFTNILDADIDETNNFLKIISPEGLIAFTQALP